MPDDPRTAPLNDVIFDYESLPTSSPLTHPIIRGSGEAVSERDQPDKYFQRPANLKISIPGLVVNNVLSNAFDVSVRWEYQVLPTFTYIDLGIELGINPLTPATVAYEARILEGTFSENEINITKVFGTTSATSQQLSQQSFPGPIVYESFINLAPPTEPIWLTRSSTAQINLPDGILEGGKSYTAIVRHLFWTQAFDTEETRFEHYLSQYAIAHFSVNEVPSASNFRTNGLLNPTIASSDKVKLSFTVSDRDGPRTMYRISVGELSEGTPFYYLYATEFIPHYETSSSNIEISYELPLLTLQPDVNYYWKVDLQDGLSTAYGEELDVYFRINSAPNITSLKANGNELAFGSKPRISNENVVISWEFDDEDADPQEAYVLVLSAGGEEFVNTGIVRSSSSSVTVPELPDGNEISVSLRIKDAIEFGTEATGRFLTNSSPHIVDLTIDGGTNPGNVSTTTPDIEWTFVDNNPSDIQSSFRIQVATDDDFLSLVWDTGDVSGTSSSVIYGSTASPTVLPATLVHGTVYRIRVKVRDSTSWSDYSVGFFSINTAPGTPLLTTPSAGSYSGTITVQWAPATIVDADGDDVTYTLEITRNRNYSSGWDLLAGPFDESVTSYEFDTSVVPSGTNYGIRVIASDGFAESNPDLGGTSARFEILNHAPNTPTITAPQSGDQVNKVLRIEWVEQDPVDIDGDSVVYEIHISEDASASTPIWNLVASVSSGTTRLLIDVSEYEDGSDYKVRIRAIDSKGEVGTYSYSQIFNIVNSVAISDFGKLGNSLYAGSNDGRVFKVKEVIWQVDEDWSQQRVGIPFELFVRGETKAEIADGKLIISPVPGTTYLFRHSDDR